MCVFVAGANKDLLYIIGVAGIIITIPTPFTPVYKLALGAQPVYTPFAFGVTCAL